MTFDRLLRPQTVSATFLDCAASRGTEGLAVTAEIPSKFARAEFDNSCYDAKSFLASYSSEGTCTWES
jgi:hypothetical protein